MSNEILGLQEVGDLAGVTSSAVANWRRRFPDFPPPLAELKSGPVFSGPSIRAWLARRAGAELSAPARFYERLAAGRGDTPELMAAVESTVSQLSSEDTSVHRPGVLLGKVQSGKTRAYLGVIARAFDKGYGVAVILTKGTRSLAQQTVSRVREDFKEFIAADEVQAYDIMSLPKLTPYELNQHLVLIVKKEDDNLRRLLTAFSIDFPSLAGKRVLVVDDEADLASISFKKEDGVVKPGKVSNQIDELRSMVSDLGFLQVTATPYSLYLQPEGTSLLASGELFIPKRPQFTVSLPTHDAYVGGEDYFERSLDTDSPASHFYKEVPPEEREALKAEDRRRLKIENVLSEGRAAVLRDALVAFLVGAAIRRIQERTAGRVPQKYSFLFHTEQARKSHEWQERLTAAMHSALKEEAEHDTPRFSELLTRAVTDLGRSIKAAGTSMPDWATIKAEVVDALMGGQLMITKVNSDKDISELLDDQGQLKLRTPMNIFIGGQILDRGVTIHNLIGFYYGRDPKRFQQDTVLQHSRMYGVRPPADLAVTRFYAPLHVYQVMRKIHAFDAALREAFESGAHDRGVYFIQKDSKNHLIPCSPNKLMLSNVASIRPGRRLLPLGFQTVPRSRGQKPLAALDAAVEKVLPKGLSEPVLVDVATAVRLLSLAYDNLEFDEADDDERRAHIAALEHLSLTSKAKADRGKVWLFGATDRRVARYREEGRFSNAPDTKQQTDLAHSLATDLPVLMLFRQEGAEEQGWRGLPFWWPVIVTPRSAATAIFSSDVATPLL